MAKKYKVFKEIVIISIMTTIINGWEYLTSIIPGDVMTQTLQNEYIKEQSIAYHMLLSHMCIPHEELKEVKEAFKNGQKSIDFKIDPIKQHLIKETQTQGKLLRQHYKKGRLL